MSDRPSISQQWTEFNGGNPSQSGATAAKIAAFKRWQIANGYAKAFQPRHRR